MNKTPLVLDQGTKPEAIKKSILLRLKRHEEEISENILTLKIPIVDKQKVVVDILTLSNDLGSESFSVIHAKKKKSAAKNSRRILVVGGAGYLGSVITRLLLKHNYKVRVLDTFAFGQESVEDLQNEQHLELIKGDIRDIQVIHKSLRNVDAVIHLAAIVGDPASQKFPQDTIGINYLATMTLALACKYYQINKFFFASTCSVYGIGEEILSESAALNPVSLYARTKIASEKGIIELADENFKPVIMRMSTLYGLSPRMRFDLVVNIFAKMATLDKKITIFGGNQWRPLLHVSDAAQAYLLALESSFENCVGDDLVFNVGSNEQNYMIKQLGEMVKTTFPDTKVIVNKGDGSSANDERTYQVSFDKIHKHLDFNPEKSVTDAILEIGEAITSGKIKKTNDKKYYNAT